MITTALILAEGFGNGFDAPWGIYLVTPFVDLILFAAWGLK